MCFPIHRYPRSEEEARRNFRFDISIGLFYCGGLAGCMILLAVLAFRHPY